jgi:hypothetical protein
MKKLQNNLVMSLTVLVMTLFISCSESEDLPEVLTIQEKVELLESNQWLLKGFEDRVMHTFSEGERFTFYGTDSVFAEPIPGTNDYTITGDLFTIDFNFGNIGIYDLEISCDNNIIEFFVDGELNSTLLRRGSNYEACLD